MAARSVGDNRLLQVLIACIGISLVFLVLTELATADQRGSGLVCKGKLSG
jgi:hypothetical protein